MKTDHYFKFFSISLVSFWLSLFVIAAFSIVVVVSLQMPTQSTLFSWDLTVQQYLKLLDPLVLRIVARSLGVAAVVTGLCLLIGYPFAYFLMQLPKNYKSLINILLIIPFWTSSLIRSYAIIAIIKAHGLINAILLKLGAIEQPIVILFTNTAVLIGLVYDLLPFMIFPIFAHLERLDKNIVHAANDLGATAWTAFWRIILPLSMPGIMAGVIFVFLPAMTLFYIPDLLGGAHSMLLGNFIQFQFLTVNNWPAGAATSIILTLFLLILIICNQLISKSRQG